MFGEYLQDNIYLSKMTFRPDRNKKNYVINEKSKIKNGILIAMQRDIQK